jgi:hypothetical protein
MSLPGPKQAGPIALLAGIAAILVLQVSMTMRAVPAGNDALQIVGVAATLLDHGVFADHFVPPEAPQPAPGRFLAPAYPALIAALGRIDTRTSEDLRCLAAKGASCPRHNPLRGLVALQTLAGLVTLLLTYWLALRMSGSLEVAGFATILMFLTGDFAGFARLVVPYSIMLAAVMVFLALLITAHTRGSLMAFAFAGSTLGFLVLLDVYYGALVALSPLLIVIAERWSPRARRGSAWAGATVLMLGAATVIAPWMGRNFLLFGDVAPARGLETILLAQRLAYNALSPVELLAGVICWLPGTAGKFSSVLDAQTASKFGLYYPGSLLNNGAHLLAGARAAASGGDPLRQLLALHVAADPVRYAMSSGLLVFRGLAATGGLVVLWGLCVLPILVPRLIASGRFGPFILVGGSVAGLTIVQALLTPNLPWMNLPLLFVYAYAIAETTGGLELPIGLRRLLSGTGRTAWSPRHGRRTIIRAR